MKRIKLPDTLYKCPRCGQITLVVANQGNFCSDRRCIYTKVKPVNFDNDINTYDYEDRALNRFSQVYTKPEGSCQDPKKLEQIRLQSNFFRGKKYILDCGYQLKISRSLCEEAVSLLLTILNCLQQQKATQQIQIVVQYQPDLTRQHLFAQYAEVMREHFAANAELDGSTIGGRQSFVGDQTSYNGEKSVVSNKESILGEQSLYGENSAIEEPSALQEKSTKGAKSTRKEKAVKGQKTVKGQKAGKGQKSEKGQKSGSGDAMTEKQRLAMTKVKPSERNKSASGTKSAYLVDKTKMFDVKSYYGDLLSNADDKSVVVVEPEKKKKKPKNQRFRNKNIFAVRFLSAYSLHALTFAKQLFFEQFNIIKFFGIDLKEWRDNTKEMNSILRGYINVVPIVQPKHIVMKVCKYRHINIEEQNAMVQMCERIAQYSTADVRYHTIAAIAFWKICQFSTRYRNRVMLQHLCKSHERLFSQGHQNMTYKFFDITPESVKKVYKQSIKNEFFTKYLPEWSTRIPLPLDNKSSMEDID